MSGITFATLQEAWGVPAFGVDAVPEAASPKDPKVQRDALERTEASQRNWAFATEYIRQVYAARGAAGVMGLMDADTARAVRVHAVVSLEWLDGQALLLGFLFACLLYLLADVMRARP